MIHAIVVERMSLAICYSSSACCNHALWLLNILLTNDKQCFPLILPYCFLHRFATPQLIERYTQLVETYTTNSNQTNIAVFTMLCHICVDCDRIDLLYTPSLLKLFGSLAHNPTATDEDRLFSSHVVKSFLNDLEMRPQVINNAANHLILWLNNWLCDGCMSVFYVNNFLFTAVCVQSHTERPKLYGV